MKKELGDALNLAVPFRQPPAGVEERILASLPAGGKASRSPGRGTWGVLAAAILVLAAGNLVQFVTAKAPGPAMKPGLLVVMLNGTEAAPKSFGTIVLDPDDNHGILAVRDLPALVGGRYQLWLKKGAEVRSAGVFTVDADGYGSLLLTVPEGFRGFREFFLSRELTGAPTPPPQVMTGAY